MHGDVEHPTCLRLKLQIATVERMLFWRLPYCATSREHAKPGNACETRGTVMSVDDITRLQSNSPWCSGAEEYQVEWLVYSRSRTRAEVRVCLWRNERSVLTRKPSFLFFSPCGRWKRGSWICLCNRKPNIATVSKGVEVLQPSQ